MDRDIRKRRRAVKSARRRRQSAKAAWLAPIAEREWLLNTVAYGFVILVPIALIAAGYFIWVHFEAYVLVGLVFIGFPLLVLVAVRSWVRDVARPFLERKPDYKALNAAKGNKERRAEVMREQAGLASQPVIFDPVSIGFAAVALVLLATVPPQVAAIAAGPPAALAVTRVAQRFSIRRKARITQRFMEGAGVRSDDQE